MSFREFYYKLLKETPHNISNSDEYYSELASASNIYDEIVNSGEYVKVFTINGEYPIDLYSKKDDNDIMCYFLPTNGNNYIYGYVYYTLLNDGGVITTSVYNDKKYVGLAFKVHIKYLLTTYKYVMSDGNHTPRGRNFWRNLIIFNIKKHPIHIWDMVNNVSVLTVNHPNDVDNFYGDEIDYERYRIRIENI